jgi:flavin-binding protein dodecin
MPDSVYRVTEVIGVSGESWEAAAQSAVRTAASTVRDLRVAEVVRQDVVIENGQESGRRGSTAAGRHHGQLARTARV